MLKRNQIVKVEKTTHLRQEIEVDGVTIKIGDVVRVPPLKGRFKVFEIRDDDALSVYGGTKNRQLWRTFDVKRCVLA